MERLFSVDDAKLLIVAWSGWFGPPLVRYHGDVIDGRKRHAAWRALCIPGDPPVVQVTHPTNAARVLLLAGHPGRALDLPGVGDLVEGAEWVLRVPKSYIAILRAEQAHRRRQCSPHARRRRPRVRAAVVARVRRLYLDSLEGLVTVTPDALRNALGEWV